MIHSSMLMHVPSSNRPVPHSISMPDSILTLVPGSSIPVPNQAVPRLDGLNVYACSNPDSLQRVPYPYLMLCPTEVDICLNGSILMHAVL